MLLRRIQRGSLGPTEGSFFRQGHDLDLVFIRQSRLEFLLVFLLSSCVFSALSQLGLAPVAFEDVYSAQ